MAHWSLDALLSRQILLTLQGANWQRAGGKGSKPKPVPLPDAKGRGDKPAAPKQSGAEMAQKLRTMGLIPPGD